MIKEVRDRLIWLNLHLPKAKVPLKTLWVLFHMDGKNTYELWFASRADAREHKQWSEKLYPDREYLGPVPLDRGVAKSRFSPWVLFDIDNGMSGSKNYLWWFFTRRGAEMHRRQQNGVRTNARVVGPFPYHARAPTSRLRPAALADRVKTERP